MVTKDEIKDVIDSFKDDEIESVILLVRSKDRNAAFINCSVAGGSQMLVGAAKQSTFFAEMLFSVPIVLSAILNEEAKTKHTDESAD